MEVITKWLSVFSAWAVSLSAIIGFLSIVNKPFRERIQRHFADKTKQAEMMKAVSEIQKDVEGIKKDVEGIKTSVSELDAKYQDLNLKNDLNERDRLRDVIFRFGNIARKGERITSEEFRHLQEVFTKYQTLGGNGIAKEEFDFIQKFYNENAKKWL